MQRFPPVLVWMLIRQRKTINLPVQLGDIGARLPFGHQGQTRSRRTLFQIPYRPDPASHARPSPAQQRTGIPTRTPRTITSIASGSCSPNRAIRLRRRVARKINTVTSVATTASTSGKTPKPIAQPKMIKKVAPSPKVTGAARLRLNRNPVCATKSFVLRRKRLSKSANPRSRSNVSRAAVGVKRRSNLASAGG